MSGDRKTVDYGHASVPGTQRVCTSAFDVERSVERIKAALEASELWLIAEIDPQAILGRAGLDVRPARQLLFFHPRYMRRILVADPAAVIEAPLEVAVLELGDGTVSGRYAEPSDTIGRYEGLEQLGSELGALLPEIVEVCTR